MLHNTKEPYIAIPEAIYREIRQFLGTHPYEQVQGVIRALETTSKKINVLQHEETSENNAQG